MHVLHGALAGCGKTISTEQDLDGLYVWDNRTRPRRMLKKTVLFVCGLSGSSGLFHSSS
jgi:hypothetical protein